MARATPHPGVQNCSSMFPTDNLTQDARSAVLEKSAVIMKKLAKGKLIENENIENSNNSEKDQLQNKSTREADETDGEMYETDLDDEDVQMVGMAGITSFICQAITCEEQGVKIENQDGGEETNEETNKEETNDSNNLINEDLHMDIDIDCMKTELGSSW